MSGESFRLKWNDFNENLGSSLADLRSFNDFFDVTLACDNAQILAHKVVLGACSPFFRKILRRNPHTHPLLYLKGIRAGDLESLVNFMYDGEVEVAQADLSVFLASAEELGIKGLTRQNPDQETYFPAQIQQLNTKESNLTNDFNSKRSSLTDERTGLTDENHPPNKRRKRVRIEPEIVQEVSRVLYEGVESVDGFQGFQVAGVKQEAVEIEVDAGKDPLMEDQVRGSAEAPNDNDDIVDNNQDIVDELPVESVLVEPSAVKSEPAETADEPVEPPVVKSEPASGKKSTKKDPSRSKPDLGINHVPEMDLRPSVPSEAKHSRSSTEKKSKAKKKPSKQMWITSVTSTPDNSDSAEAPQNSNSETMDSSLALDDSSNSRLENIAGGDSESEYNSMLEEAMKINLSKLDQGYYDCLLCDKVCRDLTRARQHLEAKHFPNTSGFRCTICAKQCKTKHALTCHNSIYHKGADSPKVEM